MTTEERINELIQLATSVICQRERFEHTCRAIAAPMPEFAEETTFEVASVREKLRGMRIVFNQVSTWSGLEMDDTLSQWEAKIHKQYDRDCNALSVHLRAFFSDN